VCGVWGVWVLVATKIWGICEQDVWDGSMDWDPAQSFFVLSLQEQCSAGDYERDSNIWRNRKAMLFVCVFVEEASSRRSWILLA